MTWQNKDQKYAFWAVAAQIGLAEWIGPNEPPKKWAETREARWMRITEICKEVTAVLGTNSTFKQFFSKNQRNQKSERQPATCLVHLFRPVLPALIILAQETVLPQPSQYQQP